MMDMSQPDSVIPAGLISLRHAISGIPIWDLQAIDFLYKSQIVIIDFFLIGFITNGIIDPNRDLLNLFSLDTKRLIVN